VTMNALVQRVNLAVLWGLLLILSPWIALAEDRSPALALQWQSLPDLPVELGVAGPFVGVHRDALIVAGGANFPRPVWEHDKVWHDQIHVLTKSEQGYQWHSGGKLPGPLAYGAAVSTPAGVVCLGGNRGDETFRDVCLFEWNADTRQVTRVAYPPLPRPCVYGQAALVDDVIYLAGGQSAAGLDSAMSNFWSLDLARRDQADEFIWRELDPWPGTARAFNLTVSQHNGREECLYVISGRQQAAEAVEFLTDVWEFTPSTSRWRRRAEVPRCVMAGCGIGWGKHQIVVLGGADGSLFSQTDQLRDRHPGFPREALVFDTVSNRWSSAGPIPRNHVTTIPVLWQGSMVIASGEIRPRVRSAKVWSIK
jgi:solute:Na+ symporter, SSS family